jgi:hypothetical protein
MPRVSHAAALFVAMAVGIGVAVLLTLWSAWSIRNGPRHRTKRQAYFMFVPVLVVPLALAIAMPDFKTALIAWLGFSIGLALSKVFTLPLAYVLARRIERRTP